METRRGRKSTTTMNNYQLASPENRKVPVVYYLCRNRQLEHPHFIQVPLSSPDGLFLRDVIDRLNVLRGRGMASMYSWSSKRNYKNGFVWHDLCEADLLLPSNGNEYVLKGSELFDKSDHFSPVRNIKIQPLKPLPAPMSSRSQDDSSSSSSMIGKTKHSQDDEQSSPLHPRGYSGMSPESGTGRNSSWNGSLSLTEYKVYKNDGLADASTQTEENAMGVKSRETCTRGVSTDDGLLDNECSDASPNKASTVKENSEIRSLSVSPQPIPSSASPSSGNNETLESLIRADVIKMNRFRILERNDIRMPKANARVKATNMLLQLISCGSISVKDNSFGLIPTYRLRFYPSDKFSSPMFSTSMMLGERDFLSENPRFTGLRRDDNEYFSGSLIETKFLREDEDCVVSLKRSSSYNTDRTCKSSGSTDNGESISGRSKCIPLSIKSSLVRQPRSESLKSPFLDKPGKSSAKVDSFRSTPSSASNCSSGRITEPFSVDRHSKRLDSFREEETVIKIEES